MQPPIPIGTVLQNRYRLISILSQGGGDRTYLAEDQGRFQERCVLKEFVPAQTTPDVLEKSRELFQREAATLYQIQQPQIPQFRATFEQDGRWFLVHDYVEGKSYRTLLNERKAQRATFSEAEVWQLLRQLLPVLAHIHSKNIIHRDISPDNIILRTGDGLPVLINFGVVKELTAQIQASSPETVIQSTSLSKLGYAPSEQIQTGRAYPSSDLYALAVTAVVLLTGKEPQELFNDIQLTWDWQQGVNVSDRFAQVLNRMLSYKPGDRYQSAAETLQALIAAQSTAPQQQNPQPPNPNPQSPSPDPQSPNPNPQPPNPDPQPPAQKVSEAQTIAIGRRPEPENSSPKNSTKPEPVSPPSVTNSLWEDPWPVIVFGLGLALLAGFGSWMVVSAILNSRQQPIIVATPTVTVSPPTPTPTPSQTPTPTPTPTAESYSQRLDEVLPGRTISKQGNLKANSTINYLFRGEQGQQLDTALTSEGILMTVLGPDQNPLENKAKRVLGWKGTLPYTGDYTIQLSPIKGLTQSDYKLDVTLANVVPPSPTPSATPTTTPTPTPTLTPTATPTPTTSPSANLEVQPIYFPTDEPAVRVSGRTSPQQSKRYLVDVLQGQKLRVEVLGGRVTLNIRDPEDQLVDKGSGVLAWTGSVANAGQYKIDVVASERTDFTLDVSLVK
jgi:serine/threonine protein kinase